MMQPPISARRNSSISGFYKKSLPERMAILAQWAGLDTSEQSALLGITGLNATQAEQMIENVVGIYALPFGIATNFQINGKDYLIPMVIEEPSVVAACSFAAKLVRAGGGSTVAADDPIMIGQLQVLDVPNVYSAAGKLWDARAQILAAANDPTSSIVKRGGGARDLELRPLLDAPGGPMLIVHLLYDCRDAMGANAVNTACERIAPLVTEVTGGRVNLRILSNLSDRRKARASCTVPAKVLATESQSGAEVAASIAEAGAFAEADPYRATTHNKGVMNGIDAVCLATGNDWRALAAGAHAYAARTGRYTSMTQWKVSPDGNLQGRIELPLAVGTVGGATRVHPIAKIAMKILGVDGAQELAGVLAAVGLAQNLAAIRALATEGIQRGHMSLHARQLATTAGATGEMVTRITEAMVAEGNIRLERAKELLAALGSERGQP